MTPFLRGLTVVLVLLPLAAASAEEQTRQPTPPSGPRIFVQLNGGYQPTTTDFRSTVPFRLTTDPTEEAQFESGYDVAAGPMVDVRGGVRLYQRLGAAVAVNRFVETGGASVRARLPHPFFFERPREISGNPDGFRREELGVHVQATYTVEVTRRISATLFGGPSFFDVRQDLVDRVEYSEEYPFDTATFTGIVKKRDSDSAVGFNVGMDVGYFFAKNIGVGGVIRFSRASVDVEPTAGRNQRVDAGGLHVGAGVRFAF